MTNGSQCLKKTPLHATHLESNAKMTEFCGWDMPVQYPNGIIAEVRAVRESAGIFDVSHMARIEFGGPRSKYFFGNGFVSKPYGVEDWTKQIQLYL